MMRDHLFCHGSGDPLSEGSPLERVPSLFFAPAPKPSSNPDALAPALPTPIPGMGDSPWTRGPQAKHSFTPARLAPARQAQESVHPTPHSAKETPRDPWKALQPPLTVAKTPQPPQTECVTRPGKPLTYPSHSGNPHPFGRGGAPPGDSTPSPPQESSPPARRLLRLLLAAAAVAGGLHSSSRSRPRRPIPGLQQAGQPPSPSNPLGGETPAQGWVLTRKSASLPLLPRKAVGGSSLRSLRETSDESGAPSPQAPSHRPNRPEAAASSQARGLSLPGGRAVHMAALRAPGGEGSAGEGVWGPGGGRGTRLNRGALAEPTWPAGEE